MTNCANIVQTKTNEASTFLNKGACPVPITKDENKMRNASKQKSECLWFLTKEKQMQKRAKNMELFKTVKQSNN